jgi:hypothetical protein
MGRLIDQALMARRLARAIASDLALYNDDALRAGADLSAEIAEGRALFRSRVIADLHAEFEQAITELLASRQGPVRDGEATSPATRRAAATSPDLLVDGVRRRAERAAPPGFFAAPDAAPRGRGRLSPVVIGVLVLGIGASLLGWLTTR